MAHDMESLRHAMRRGHVHGERLDGSIFHARAACRVVFSPARLPVDGPLLLEIERWLEPGPMRARRWRMTSAEVQAARRRVRGRFLRLAASEPSRAEVLPARLDKLAEAAGLSPTERDVLVLAGSSLFERLANLRARENGSPPVPPLFEVLAIALAKPTDDIAAALAPSSKLSRSKLVEMCTDGPISFGLAQSAARWVREEVESAPLEAIYEVVPATTLVLGDFGHVGLDAELLRDHLRVALDAGRATKVGLRGPRESGRTSLVSAIAGELGATVLTLRKDVDALTGADITRLRLALGTIGARTILVIEADRDAPPPPWERRVRRSRRPMIEDDKVELAELGVPMIRMLAPHENRGPSPFAFMMSSEPPEDLDLVVEVPTLPEPLRLGALVRAAGLTNGPAPRWLADAAARAASPTAVAKHAKIVSALGHADPAVAERHLAHLVSREGSSARLAPPTSALAYDPAWLRTDVPVELMLAAMGRSPMGRILMHGEPGTGKSRLARELARRGGLEVVSRTGSELLSMWLGGTEKNLAAAFEEASKRGALLLLDEVDSFLSSRRRASHGHEVTQVNELLVQIESFRGWLVCTTNFCAGLDEAALRRFPIKVQFFPPDERQRRALFDAAVAALGLTERDDERACVDRILARASRLTPGDVAAVVEQVQILGGVESGLALAERLEREVSYKSGGEKKVGFG